MNPSQLPDDDSQGAVHLQMRTYQQGGIPPPDVSSYTSITTQPQSSGQISNQLSQSLPSYKLAESSSQAHYFEGLLGLSALLFNNNFQEDFQLPDSGDMEFSEQCS
ncbi:hypothetical protein PCANC_11069 [Puccinia coronata f. sp. avenae]|uniref:Uncharacterized protein n=1 Tax=Puccinia coronata f. sp. avenae TaxID=200324 RepID=A0A2N5UW66_9BASI|nr:hypothetical protein PCANC_11069 [Puccinia coronata f. sp. avenae]